MFCHFTVQRIPKAGVKLIDNGIAITNITQYSLLMMMMTGSIVSVCTVDMLLERSCEKIYSIIYEISCQNNAIPNDVFHRRFNMHIQHIHERIHTHAHKHTFHQCIYIYICIGRIVQCTEKVEGIR